ncbi:imelysin family protein [uncultured Endozoicomonas sp.]|uniref:imelysin family protein n=1 Tax=uncultured Endozoicomonas sp. TaxID=432652 RepID=UPI00261DE605|nr:imelysin family protein [uncultured Endozoicomonas sp.]
MKKSLSLLILSLGLMGCNPSDSVMTEPTRSPITLLIEEQIQLAWQQLVAESTAYNQLTTDFCQPDATNDIGLLQAQWKKTMLRWQTSETLSQLMLEENMEGWRFQFWPDKKNLTGRKVEARVAAENPIPILSDSVILQGLSAAEYLLFDQQVLEALNQKPSAYCQFLIENSESILANSQELQQQWQSNGTFFTKAVALENATENPLSLDGWVLNTLDSQTARLKKELSLPFSDKRTNLYLAESWRSGQSLEHIRQVISTFHAMTALASQQTGNTHPEQWQEINNRLNSLSQSVDTLPHRFSEVIEQDKIEDLKQFKIQVDNLHASVVAVSKDLHVPLGFNSSDGD